jgi:hypothetical protein
MAVVAAQQRDNSHPHRNPQATAPSTLQAKALHQVISSLTSHNRKRTLARNVVEKKKLSRENASFVRSRESAP